jgi:hypothetical protein
VDKGPFWIGVLGWDKTEKIEQLLEEIFGNGNFKDENNPVQEDDNPHHQRKSLTNNGILQRNHKL